MITKKKKNNYLGLLSYQRAVLTTNLLGRRSLGRCGVQLDVSHGVLLHQPHTFLALNTTGERHVTRAVTTSTIYFAQQRKTQWKITAD